MNREYDVIKRPILTEKSSLASETMNKYAFEVAKDATKTDIKRAIEKVFDVKVNEVKTMIVHGKWKRFAQGMKKRPNWKKALVHVDAKDKIEFFRGK